MLLNLMLLLVLLLICYASLSVTGDDHQGLPNRKLSDYVEFIKCSQKQGDMILVVPDGDFAVRLGKDASMNQTLKVEKGRFYSVAFSVARTFAQQEKLCWNTKNVSLNHFANTMQNTRDNKRILVLHTLETEGFAVAKLTTFHPITSPIIGAYCPCKPCTVAVDSYAWGFQADAQSVDFMIHNPGVSDDPACGPIIDSIALKPLSSPKRTRDNILKNGNFEEGPYILPNALVGVLIPPKIEDDHSPLPGWMIESSKAVKYIDSAHFAVPEGEFAIELMAGVESALTQIVYTIPGKLYALTFLLGDANDGCEGPLAIKAFAGKESLEVSYTSNGKGGHRQAILPFKADSIRTRVMFYSLYTMKTGGSGSLCGPVIDDVRLVSVRNSHHT